MYGIIFGIVGNKCDLYEEEDVSEKEAIEFSSSINAFFKLTSERRIRQSMICFLY